MTDYVERNDAVRIAERYGTSNGSVLGRHSGVADCIASEITKLQAANVVRVVRCGNCKYKLDTIYCRLRKVPVIVANGDYCSYGKTK